MLIIYVVVGFILKFVSNIILFTDNAFKHFFGNILMRICALMLIISLNKMIQS